MTKIAHADDVGTMDISRAHLCTLCVLNNEENQSYVGGFFHIAELVHIVTKADQRVFNLLESLLSWFFHVKREEKYSFLNSPGI